MLKDAPLDKEENQASRAPSEWGVYSYFLKSCGVAGITLFFVLAAILAGERSFESEFYRGRLWCVQWIMTDFAV